MPQMDAVEENLERMTVEFAQLVDKNKYSADEIREAYYRLCGVSDNDEKKNDNGIENIVSKMKEMENNGYPLNRFVKLIDAKQIFENAVTDYYNLVNSLNISKKEKQILRTIVDDARNGEIYCFINGDIFAGFRINANGAPRQILASALAKNLKDILERIPEGKKYEFQFAEE